MFGSRSIDSLRRKSYSLLGYTIQMSRTAAPFASTCSRTNGRLHSASSKLCYPSLACLQTLILVRPRSSGVVQSVLTVWYAQMTRWVSNIRWYYRETIYLYFVLVPGIAQEYIRKRAQFDKTAREWTRLYATSSSSAARLPTSARSGALPAHAASSTGVAFFDLPPLPPASPQTSLNAIPPTVLPIPSSSRPTRSTRALRRTTANTSAVPVPTITSADSQPATSSYSQPATSTIIEVIDLSSSPQRRGIKRRRDDNGVAPAPKRRATRRNGASSTSSGDGGEVIVIEDDD